MPNIRCRFYDDRGNLTVKSHEPEMCRFVHPGTKAWDTAVVSRPGPRRTDFPLSSRSSDGPSTSFRASASGSTKSRDNSFDWNHPKGTSGWGNNDASKDWGTSETTLNKPPANAAAGQSSWADAINSVPDETPGWGSTSSWASQGGGWGNATEDTTQKEGPSASVRGKEKSTRDNAGPSWADAISGNFDRDRLNKGKGPDVVMEDPPPPVPFINPPPSFASQASYKKRNPDPPRSNEAPVDRSRTESFSPTSPTQPIASDTPKLPSTMPKFKTLASMSFFDGTGNSEGSQGGSSVSLPFKGYTGRVAWFKKVVLHMQEAVMYQIMCIRAEAEAARWKQTCQNSAIYARPTVRARTIIESQQHRYAQKVSIAQTKRKQALEELARLPGRALSSRSDNSAEQDDPTKTREIVEGYIKELKEWFQDLDLHKRIVMAKDEAPGATPKPVSAQEGQPEKQSPEDDTFLGGLLEKTTWTWGDLKTALRLIETSIEDTTERVYTKKYTQTDDSEEHIIKLASQLAPSMPHSLPVNAFDEDIQLTDFSVDEVGTNIQSEADKAAVIFSQIDGLKKEIEALRSERSRIEAFCETMEAQFSEFERCSQADDMNIRELTEQIKNLHLHKRPSAASAPLLPTKIEDHLGHIEPFVLQIVRDELEIISQNLVLRCSENQAKVAEEVNVMLQPVLESTAQISQIYQPTNTVQAGP
ncbi:hypothetical protein HYPSUDRAFT_62153 [Hypholoma sublateritium FD-334 SS-4]|uniref:Uncharacterized protein n=1 Tax=Hypholoma sublateritium (strain FD-334 SS-4) TaxID=945553 RepID=A0A0D2MWV6_HYPSF|nr:hypothetical protein HYPSUDRAFT_62153 [Hypholoma sublateritium FD-334 SS-4]